MRAPPRGPRRARRRRACPTPAYLPPATDLERTLAGLWEEAQGLERVGRHEHFFDLGGDSLAAVRVASNLRDVVDAAIDVRQFFEAPTVAGLARSIDATRSSSMPVVRSALVPLKAATARDAITLCAATIRSAA